MGNFATVTDGREWCCTNLPRHTHDEAYVAIVLDGYYEECGSRGRFRVGPGDVLLHDAFDAHLNRFARGAAHILNLVVPGLKPFSIGRLEDPDAIVRAAEHTPAKALRVFYEQIRPSYSSPEDWPDMLARDLLADPDRRLDRWAREHGLAAATLSRGFAKVFGVTPASFRLEARTRRALALVAAGEAPLASAAAAAGFADQAHMCRALRALTGSPPSVWAKSNSFKTQGAVNT